MSLRRKARRELRARLHSVYCQRCVEEEVAGFLVSSDIIDMTVCAKCAEDARRVGLVVKQIRRLRHAA